MPTTGGPPFPPFYPLPVAAGNLVPITGGWTGGSYFPAIMPVQPYLLPPDPFDLTINAIGVRLGWGKSHSCPCSYYPVTQSVAGSPNAQCTTCSGRGVYWEDLVPFVGIISYGHRTGVRDEPGMQIETDTGLVVRSEPTLTIPYSAGVPWMQCSEYDLIVEVDAQTRFNASLAVGGTLVLPYQFGVNVPITGAVTTWATGASGVGDVIAVTGYAVNGATLIPPVGLASGTPLMVEYFASPAYVCFRIGGGYPHNRPFNQGRTAYPKRFHLTATDLWLRGLRAGAF